MEVTSQVPPLLPYEEPLGLRHVPLGEMSDTGEVAALLEIWKGR